MQSTFKRNAHVRYFERCLAALPTAAEGHDSNRITIAFFCLSGLELLGALKPHPHGPDWIEWVWSLQAPTGGFRGSTFDPSSPGHLPSTYTALLVLGILRAPLDRLDIPNLRSFLHACRAGDAFSPLPNPPLFDFQADVRMTYCAAVVADMINEALPGAERFLESCATWEGGYAAKPGMIEAQGGTTYCAVAALTLLGRPVDMQVLRWASQRQIGGFQGRPGKLQDVCYSFWIGAALQILGQPIVDAAADRAFLLSSQSPIGGFGKDPDDMPDPYHSYLALAALALSDPELTPLDPLWNSTKTTAAWLKDEFTRCIQR